MFRRIIFLLLAVSIPFAVAADNTKKGKGTTKTTTTVVTTSTTNITASEGSTAMAIRGIVEPGDGWMVIGYTGTTFTARDRATGRTFKFSAPANSYRVGQGVAADIVHAHMNRADPCCSIASVNPDDHTALVNERAVRRTFTLKFTASLPGEMRAGQVVNANFKTGVASIGSWSGPITHLSQSAGLHP